MKAKNLHDVQKKKSREGKIQLINAKDLYKHTKLKLGEKSKEVSDEQILQIIDIYQEFKENQKSKIYNNNYFKYTKVTIDQYLKDTSGNIIKDKKGHPKIDTKKRDYERIPSDQEIEKYLLKEVHPHIEDYFYNKNLDKIGYEFSLTKEFYEFKNLKSVEDIKSELVKLNKEITSLEKDI